MDRKKIAIDSLNGLIDYIIKHDLDDTKKNQLRALDNTIGLHFSLGMYIRNHYELSDESKVPKLIYEFRTMWVEDHVERSDEKDEETRSFYTFLFRGMPLDDEISAYIIKEIWGRMKTAE
ncbi:DUF6794 domain-containing protein [Paenibacillus kandeliae]|uniref:DUF6794 domain-containing protein n=1 Tax=Paenibacillus kandeliae TaxID=3231269 RepID=UPI00345AB6E2